MGDTDSEGSVMWEIFNQVAYLKIAELLESTLFWDKNLKLSVFLYLILNLNISPILT